VLPGRGADAAEDWLREHPGVEVVCGMALAPTPLEAIRRALPDAVQVGDRWHLWHNLAEAVRKEVAAHSACWAKATVPAKDGARAVTTRERWAQVHVLLDQGVGLLECARRLNLALNTVKRYARVPEPERLVRAPQYRPTLVDPYRDHLRRRRAEEPAVPSSHGMRNAAKLCTNPAVSIISTPSALRNGLPPSARPICPTCTPSPAASTWAKKLCTWP
jgi:hypothetical protein